MTTRAGRAPVLPGPRPRRRRALAVVVVAAVALLGSAGVLGLGKVAALRRLGTPVRIATAVGPAAAPLDVAGAPAAAGGGAPTRLWRAEGPFRDSAIDAARGQVIAVEEVAHRLWRATARDARTGAVRWSNARGHTGHIEAWAVTDAAVVLAYHHSASTLAWRTHRAAAFEGLDPVSGRVLWTRHVYNLLGERPGDFAPALASPAQNIVYARTEFGVPTAIDTRTGRTLWAHPGLNDCVAADIAAGPAGVAMTQRCPQGKFRVELLDPRTGTRRWSTLISSSHVLLLAVGTGTVALYHQGVESEIIVLGPEGGYAAELPCDCGEGADVRAAASAATLVVSRPGQPLVGIDAATGAPRWTVPPAAGSRVSRLLAGAAAVVAVLHPTEDLAGYTAGEGPRGVAVRIDPAAGAQTPMAAPGALTGLVGAAGAYVLLQLPGALELARL